MVGCLQNGTTRIRLTSSKRGNAHKNFSGHFIIKSFLLLSIGLYTTKRIYYIYYWCLLKRLICGVSNCSIIFSKATISRELCYYSYSRFYICNVIILCIYIREWIYFQIGSWIYVSVPNDSHTVDNWDGCNIIFS